VWWSTPVIITLQRLREGDQKFKASLGYTRRLFKKKKKASVQEM
jgi:hypothetical protein